MRIPTVLCLAALGCAPPPAAPPTLSLPPLAESASAKAPPAPPAPAPAPTAEERPVSFHLDSAQAFPLLAAMEELGGEPVLVDVAALDSLKCAGVSVSTPGPLPASVALETAAAAFRDLHYRVVHEAGRWVVSIDPSSPPAACPSRSPAASAPPPMSPEQMAAEVARGIRKVSNTEFVLTQQAFDAFLEHQAELLKSTRVVPEKDASRTKVLGIRLDGVSPTDTLGRLGLVNGDRLEKLAGRSLASPDQALEAYVEVTKARRAVLEVVRKGARLKILYRIE